MSARRSINREIFNLAGPNILSNISVPLISSVDTALMGHLSSTHLGAVGLGAMLFNFLYWNFGFLRMGTTGVTAQAFGRSDRSEVIMNLARSLVVALGIGLALLALHRLLGSTGFILLNTPESHFPLAMEYFNIRIWAAPATLGLYAMMGWFFGMQNAIYPLILTIFINIANVVLSVIWVNYYGYGIEGVAMGTLIAQYAGLVFAGLLWFIRYKGFRSYFIHFGFWKWSAFRSFFQLNGNIFIRTICLSFAFAFFYNRSAAYGSIVLDANVVLLQFLHWMSYGVDGFAYAAESLSGRYRGAMNLLRFQLSVRWSFFWGGVLALFYALIYGIWGANIIQLFTDIAHVQDMAENYLWWMVALPIAGFASYVWDGVFVGITAGKSMRNAMVLALLVYLVAVFTVGKTFENHGLWASLLIFLLARAVFQQYLYNKKGWNLN